MILKNKSLLKPLLLVATTCIISSCGNVGNLNAVNSTPDFFTSYSKFNSNF